MITTSLKALKDAFLLARSLPEDTVWSVMLTHDVASDNAAAFNIWVKDEAARIAMRQHLRLGRPEWEDDETEQHSYTSCITLSIIENKETNP